MSELKEAFELLVLAFVYEHAEEGITEEFLEKYADIMDWTFVSYCGPVFYFSDDFIERYEDMIDWEVILEREDVSEDFLIKHAKRIVEYCDVFWITNTYKRETMVTLFSESIKQAKSFQYNIKLHDSLRNVYLNRMRQWYQETRFEL